MAHAAASRAPAFHVGRAKVSPEATLWSDVASGFSRQDDGRVRPMAHSGSVESVSGPIYCTLAVTDALAFSAKVHVLVLLPPLEQAPDQIASRPFVTLSVIEVPTLNDADPLVPTLTLIPAGLDVTRSPLRPVAATVRVAVCPGGFTVSVVVRVTPA